MPVAAIPEALRRSGDNLVDDIFDAIIALRRQYVDYCGRVTHIAANMLPFEAQSPAEVATELARRLRTLRLQRGWTQAEAAARSGMTLASYKRFERTGEIAFKSLLKIALAFDQLGRLESLFDAPVWQSLDEALASPTKRVRAPRRRSP